ncbi:MAG: glycosyltransferase [Eubacterium sp.]|nr:glycosyltransferase [Eubacterium sp.]
MDTAERWRNKRPDERMLKELIENRRINLLCGGRIKTEQDCYFLLDIVKIFRLNYEDKIKLRIISSLTEGLAAYEDLLKKKIRAYQLGDCIEFVDNPADVHLMSYYLGSDIMLYVGGSKETNHLVREAQFFSLPVLTWEEDGIQGRIEHDHLVLEKRPELFASAVHVLMENRGYAEYLSEWGKRTISEGNMVYMKGAGE